MKRARAVLAALGSVTTLALACSSAHTSDASTPDASAPDAAAPPDAAAEDAAAKAAPCVPLEAGADAFGQGIDTVGFARFDGTVVAVLPVDDQQCAEPNSTHAIIEMQFAGALYRMVLDVDDEDAPNTIRTYSMQHPLVGEPWSDGWHTKIPLDYVTTFSLHSTSFASVSTSDAVAWFTSQLALGAHISVFATAQGEPDSAHLVHRNLTSQDGALVIGPDTPSPLWLLFAFSNQTF